MDRHVKWLRRRIVASIATQTAETFTVVAVLAFVVMQWRTDEGPLTALFGSVVIAQLVAGARIGHAMRNNPLNYVFMRGYVDQPFTYRVARFQGEEDAHAVAEQLPGFAPVATIRDSEASPEPVFDVYHDPSRLVAASVSRASGSVSLISSLADGRILVTDARAMPPHERLVMSLADEDSLQSVIATHRRAVSARTDVVELASSAHQVVLDSLAVEYDAYVTLGPALSPFLDLEPGGKSWLRLIARIKPAEFTALPSRLGPDLPAAKTRVAAPEVASSEPAMVPTAEPLTPNELVVPEVVAPRITSPEITMPEVAAPQVVEVVAPAPVVAPSLEVVAPALVVTPSFEVVAPAPVVDIAPPAFVTVEPEAADFVAGGEPITAEVPAINGTGTSAPSAEQADVIDNTAAVDTAPVEHTESPATEVPLDLAAAIASLATVPPIAPAPEPASVPSAEPAPTSEPVVPVATEAAMSSGAAEIPPVHPEPTAHVVVADAAALTGGPFTTALPETLAPVAAHDPAQPLVADSLPVAAPGIPEAAMPTAAPQFVYESPVVPDRMGAVAPVPEPLPDFILQPPAATLAEAVVSAPDTPEALGVPTAAAWPAPAAHLDDGEPMLVSNLSAALGRTEGLSPTRPRLSAVIRANEEPRSGGASGRRSRRKSR